MNPPLTVRVGTAVPLQRGAYLQVRSSVLDALAFSVGRNAVVGAQVLPPGQIQIRERPLHLLRPVLRHLLLEFGFAHVAGFL